MQKIILSEKWTGLCNQLFALANGILQAKRLRHTTALVGPFSPEVNRIERIPVTTVIDLDQTGRNVGIKLISGDSQGRCTFDWYNRHSEPEFVSILQSIIFQPILYEVAEELCQGYIDLTKPIHVVHFRTEQDGIHHWSQMNKMTQDVFQGKLHSQYRKAIKHIPAGEQIVALTYDTDNPLLDELKNTHKVVILNTREIVKERVGHSGRELCAIIDLLVGLKCTGTFVGCHNFQLKRGSTFSYVLWKLMSKSKQGVFIDLDNINKELHVLQPIATKPTVQQPDTFSPPLVKADELVSQEKTWTDRKNYIYFHICTLGPWKTVVHELFQRVISSGLIDVVEKVHVVVLGVADEVKQALDHPKVTIVFNSKDNSIYERKCLSLLREHADRENCRFLYIHSKGISKRAIGITDWIELLTYFNIEQHQQCIQELEHFDTVSVNINSAEGWVLKRDATEQDPAKAYHYSGNFWWANSEYIKTLSKTIGPKYIDPELWIGGGEKKNMLSLWQSGINHYTHRYPRTTYVGKTSRCIYQTGDSY